MDTIRAGVHIFGRKQSKAVDNFNIYIEITPDKDFSTFLKELKVDNGFNERCAKHDILNYDLDLTVHEKKDQKLVVINNNTAWKHAKKLLLRDEAELHVKLYDVKRTSSCSFFESGKSSAQDAQDVTCRTHETESFEPAKKKKKSHHANHTFETKAKISLWNRLKDAKKMGVSLVRNDNEKKLFQEFKKDIAGLASSVAVNEIDISCGLCGKTVMMNKVRARAYFIKKHFTKCQEEKKNQMTIETCLKKRKHKIQDDNANNPEQDENNNDGDVQEIRKDFDNNTIVHENLEETNEPGTSKFSGSGDKILYRPLQPVKSKTSLDIPDQFSSLTCDVSGFKMCELQTDIHMTPIPEETCELPTGINITCMPDETCELPTDINITCMPDETCELPTDMNITCMPDETCELPTDINITCMPDETCVLPTDINITCMPDETCELPTDINITCMPDGTCELPTGINITCMPDETCVLPTDINITCMPDETCELPTDINITCMPDGTFSSDIPDNTSDLNEINSKNDCSIDTSDSISSDSTRSLKLTEFLESETFVSIPDDQLNIISASDDYDSCSDIESEFHDENMYENVESAIPLHMSNPCFDAGGERRIFTNRVAERLDMLISKGMVPDNHIFYKMIDNITKFIHHSNIHQNGGIKFTWDPIIVNWCNSLLYLGGNKTYNFVRGPGNFKMGRQSPFDLARFNLPLPDERTCRRCSPSFTTRPGIVIELLLCLIHLLKNMSVCALVENERSSIFATSMARDGIGLKPELSFDPIRKVLVGAKFDIDSNYVKNNPHPDIKTLKDAMIKDADTLVLTDLTNSVSLPVGLDYSPHIQSSEDVKALVEKRVQEAQICSGCLELKKGKGKVVGDVDFCCTRSCDSCSNLGQLCSRCERNGQISVLPQLRACERCIENRSKCVRMAVMVVIHDCEQKNKSSMEKMIDDKITGRQIPDLRLTDVGPDAVHIGKCLVGSLSNWWLLVDNYRINLVILRMLRQTETITGNVLRESISLDSVQRKDRQSTAAIAEISSEKVLNCLQDSQNDVVICTIVPEKYRKCDDNHPSILKEPVDICLADDSSVLYVADRVGIIYSVRLHYPAEVKQLAKGLSKPSSMMNLDGILFVCEMGKHQIIYIDHKDTLKIDISKSTKKNLCEYAKFLEINEPDRSNLKTLRQNVIRKLEAADLPRGQKELIRVLNIGIEDFQPTALEKVDKELFFVADQKTKSILQISIKRKITAYGYDLIGTILYSINVPELSGCFGLAFCSNHLYLADHRAGILRIDLESNTVSLILNTDTPFCSQPHGICIVAPNLIYSDVAKRSLYMINDIENVSLNQPNVVLFAGKEEEGNEDGLGKDCKFSQPSGMCNEGNTLFVIDSGSKNVRLVTSLSSMHKYLSVLGDIYKSFSVHSEILGHGHSSDIKMSISKLKAIESFFEKCTTDAKALLELKVNCLQGPHGLPASKTIQSVHMLRTTLESLFERIIDINSKYLEEVDINSALTLVNEQLHSMLRLKTETPSVLDCARDFLRGVIECVKRVSLCGYHYFTSKKTSGYEIPKAYLSLEQFPKFQRDKASSVSKEDVILMLEYREKYGKGVRQRSIRADTTKFNAGTLPLNMYQNNVPPKVSSIDLSVPDIAVNEATEDPLLGDSHITEQLQSSTNKPVETVLNSIYDVNDLVAVVLDDRFSLCRIMQSVSKTDKTCKGVIYKEKNALEFHKDMQRDLPVDCILDRVTPSFQDVYTTYTLDDELYDKLVSTLQTDTTTFCEKANQILETEEEILLSCEVTKRGRTVRKPRHLMDFY